MRSGSPAVRQRVACASASTIVHSVSWLTRSVDSASGTTCAGLMAAPSTAGPASAAVPRRPRRVRCADSPWAGTSVAVPVSRWLTAGSPPWRTLHAVCIAGLVEELARRHAALRHVHRDISALQKRPGITRASCGARAMPRAARRCRSPRPPHRSVYAARPRQRPVRHRRPRRHRSWDSIAVNSSPPIRARTPRSPMVARKRRVTSRRMRSPVSCSSVSLTSLKRHRSSISSAAGAASLQSRRTASMSATSAARSAAR